VSLVPCPECGHQVAASASTCPNCGAKLGIGLLTKLVIAGGSVIALLLVIGSLTKSDPDRERDKARIETCFALSPQMHSTTHDEECQALLRAYKSKHGRYP